MNEYNVSINGWNGGDVLFIKAKNESEAIYKALKQDGSPFASVYEVELIV